VRLPESPFRLVPSCVYFGCTAGLLFGIAGSLGLGFAPGSLICLSLGMSLSLGFGFGFTARPLFRFPPGLLFYLSLGFGFAARPLFGFASDLLFGFAPGLGLGVAVRLLFGLSSGFGFTAALLLFCFATRLLFCFATRLLFCFATRALFGFATRPLFRFASGLGFGLFGFAPSSLLGFTVRRVRGLSPCLCLGFATGLLLGEPCPRLRLFGVDCVALCQRLPFRREAHLPFLGLPPSEHVSDRTSAIAIWKADACKDRDMIPLEERFPRPSVMGVLNVTPDSFSDGGVHLDPDVAAAAAWRMLEEGVAIVDVGGESTRPGSGGISAEEELSRVVPVLDRLRGELPFSIDTSKAAVAEAALERGAILVNDVTALRGDPELAGIVGGSNAYLCLMHMQGEPRTMQHEPEYGDVASEVAAFLEERMAFAVAEGIPEERICLDPGIGFGKTVEHNLELVRRLDVLLALGRPVLVGFSRKSSLRRLTGSDDLLGASVAAAVAAFERGATILRVHDVRPTVDALTVAAAVA
jgi:dihydropteroate synthase